MVVWGRQVLMGRIGYRPCGLGGDDAHQHMHVEIYMYWLHHLFVAGDNANWRLTRQS